MNPRTPQKICIGNYCENVATHLVYHLEIHDRYGDYCDECSSEYLLHDNIAVTPLIEEVA